MNEQYSEEDYRELVKHYDLRSHHGLQELLSLWKEGRGQYPQDSNYNFGSDDCSGDYIVNAKNCNNSYMVGEECRDCVNMFNAFPRLTDAMNGAYSGEDSELMYETICSGASCSRLFFCHVAVLGSHDLYYCNAAYNCQDCFGCSSIRGAQYCILNKQYSREEYFIMRDSIIEHMKKTGEWGQFFPPEMSLCGYNKSVAGDFFPLSQEEVLERGWKWEEDGEITVREGCEVIDNINDVEVEVCVQVLSCEVTGSPYKILPMELAFYRRIEIAIPQKCPEQRYLERLEMCNKVKL